MMLIVSTVESFSQVSALYSDVDHELAPEVTQRIRDGGLARSSRRQYMRAVTTFRAWCERSGRRALPCTAATLTSYTHHLTTLDWAPSSLNLHIAAVVWWHTDNEQTRPDPWAAHKVVRSYARERAERGVRVRQAEPLTVEHLRKMVATRDPRTITGCRDRCLVLIGYGLMARESILPRVDLADLRINGDGMRVAVRVDKRQPTGRTVVIPRLERGDPLCVVAATEAWVGMVRAAGYVNGPLLRPVSAAGTILGRPLSVSGLDKLFYAMVADAGLSGDITTHSLRAGACTDAYDAGADPVAIANHGGWKPGSSVLWAYIRGRDAWRNNPIQLALQNRQVS